MMRRSALTVVLATLAVSASCSTDPGRANAADRTITTIPASLGEPVARNVSHSGELYVVHGDGATTVQTTSTGSDRFTIVMSVSDPVLAFTDRPHRGAERITAADLVEDWSALGFADDPPNAALTGSSSETDVDLAVELDDPRWNTATATLTISARTIGADRNTTPPAQLDDASLFIDDAQTSAAITLSTGTTQLSVESVDAPFNPAGPDGQTAPLLVETSSAGATGPLAPDTELTGPSGFAVIEFTNPQPGVPFTASFTVADGPLQWTVSATFAADGDISGTVTQEGLSPSAQAQARSLYSTEEFGHAIPELQDSGESDLLAAVDITRPLSFSNDAASLRWN
jgi:hypothetical protein